MLRYLTIRKFQLTLLCLVCVAKSYGQTDTVSSGGIVIEVTKEKKPKKIYSKVEITKAFRGGDSAWVKEVEDDLNRIISVKNKVNAGKYILSVKFLLEKDGSLADIRCLNDPGFEVCEQIMGVIARRVRRWGGPIKVKEFKKSAITLTDSIPTHRPI